MSIIAPQTDVYLLKVPLEIDEKNQLDFADAAAQSTYFLSLPKVLLENFTYQRKDGVIRVPLLIDDIMEYNYVMYRNEGHGSKWYFAYISGMEYMNDNVTAVSIKTDVWQTYQFDLTYKKTFVEREHVNDDTEGLHTVPEGLELGDYEIVDLRDSPLWNEWSVCFCVTKLPSSTTNVQADGTVAYDAGWIGGVFSSLKFFATNTLAAAREIINIYNNDGDLTADAIKNIYMIPTCCVNKEHLSGNSSVNGYAMYALYNYYHITDEDDNHDPIPFRLLQPSVLAGNYTPVNKKLLTYPFSYFYVTNKSGQTVEYHYEDFPLGYIGNDYGRIIAYEKTVIPCASCSAKLYFTNYKAYEEQAGAGTKLYSYGIDYPKIPICAWTTDYYTNWLTQNGVNVGTNLAMGVAGAALGIATGGLGLVAGGLSLANTIASTVGEVHKAQTTPPQAHGDVNTGDFQYAMQRSSISFYEMSIRPEYAKIIDNYFSMFGYKVNEVKVPNIKGRRYWNFIKTVGCYIEADIPQSDLQEIKNMFDTGFTIWHDPTKFLDYSQSNAIVTP